MTVQEIHGRFVQCRSLRVSEVPGCSQAAKPENYPGYSPRDGARLLVSGSVVVAALVVGVRAAGAYQSNHAEQRREAETPTAADHGEGGPGVAAPVPATRFELHAAVVRHINVGIALLRKVRLCKRIHIAWIH